MVHFLIAGVVQYPNAGASKFLFVGATSYWSYLTHATDGDHDDLTHDQIRARIQTMIYKHGA